MSEPRLCHAVFCEDIRLEMGGKMSFMGVFGPQIMLPPTTPIGLNKLMIPLWFRTGVDDPIKNISVVVTGTDPTKEISRILVPEITTPPPKPNSKFYWVNFFIHIQPFIVDGPGIVEVTATVDGKDYLAGRLHVIIAENPAEMIAAQSQGLELQAHAIPGNTALTDAPDDK